jgi:hypothetical protein
METMTVVASGGIRVPCENGFAMDAFGVSIICMTDCAFLDDPDFIPFPWGHLVNVFMAVFTLNVIDEMGARIMFRPLLLMASMTGDGFSMNSCAFCFLMGLDVCDIPVTTIAGIGSMNGLGKLPLCNLIPMATQTFGVIDTLRAIFATPDDKLLSLLSCFRRFGHHCGLGTLFFKSRFRSPKRSKNGKEGDRDDKESKD